MLPAAGGSHTASAFFIFFVKQKSARCLRALKSERQRKKDLKMNKSFDHVSGSFGLC